MEGYLDIGKIINTHGVKGEVKVIPFTDDPERYRKLKQVYLDRPSGLETYHISGVKFFKNTVIIKFKEINDMETAEALKETVIKIERKDAVKLPKNSYFVCDILGCEVIDENGRSLGILKDVLQTGANDVYVVRNENNREILIPAIKSVVERISLEDKKINVTLPKGLLDDEV